LNPTEVVEKCKLNIGRENGVFECEKSLHLRRRLRGTTAEMALYQDLESLFHRLKCSAFMRLPSVQIDRFYA